MKNETIKKLLIANLIVTVVLVILVFLLMKWTIPSTAYQDYILKVDGSAKGYVGWVTDLPGNKIRVSYRNYNGEFVVGDFFEDRVKFEKPQK